MNDQEQAIVITGCGWATPFAVGGIETVLQTAPGPAPDLDKSQEYRPIPDDLLAGFAVPSPECRNDPGAWLTAVAFECVRRDASFVSGSIAPERVGLVLGHALAGQSGMIDFANDVRQQSPRFVSPIRFPQTVGNYISGALSRAYDLRGPNSTIANGLASGLDAIVEGCALLSAKKADVVFAGGTERLTSPLAMGLSEPGVTLSDGACLFALERREYALARGAVILATVVPSVGQLRPEPRASARATPPAFDPIRSVAGPPEPDVIFIEHWIGRCLGALSAAAVAAAIGAARGLAVPVVDPANMSMIGLRQPCASNPSATTTSIVTAGADDGHQTSVTLLIPGAALRPAEQ